MDRTDRVLLIDPDSEARAALAELLREEDFAVEVAETIEHGLARLERPDDVDVVVAEIDQGPLDGYALLNWVQSRVPGLPVLLTTRAPTIEAAVRAIHGGAHELLQKPPRPAEAVAAVRHAARQRLRGPQADRGARAGEEMELLGGSPPMVEVYRQIARAARGKVPVLVEGESGTGKELVARAIHRHSERSHARFVALNCGALSDSLLESELFGHVRGAFTGAERERKGLFVHAEGGTLFLDEIGEVSPRLQVQLLRALQNGEVRPVGSDAAVRADVRVIAATHRDLASFVKEGRFREDLYYRLKVAVIRVPPLRDRLEDVPVLVDRFLRATGRSLTVEEDALTLLQAYHWPGNVRELENVIARAVAMGRGPVVTADDLPAEIRGDDDGGTAAIPGGVRTLAEVERDYTRRILSRCGGNKSRAARLLDIDRKTLARILSR